MSRLVSTHLPPGCQEVVRKDMIVSEVPLERYARALLGAEHFPDSLADSPGAVPIAAAGAALVFRLTSA